jgi:hypothetical protein
VAGVARPLGLSAGGQSGSAGPSGSGSSGAGPSATIAQAGADAATTGGSVLGAVHSLPAATAAATKNTHIDLLVLGSALMLLMSAAAFSFERRLRRQ